MILKNRTFFDCKTGYLGFVGSGTTRMNIQKTHRWIYACEYATFEIHETSEGDFSLSVGGPHPKLLGKYPSPTAAVIALSKKSTQNAEWNKFLLDKDVPTKFRDWEFEERV